MDGTPTRSRAASLCRRQARVNRDRGQCTARLVQCLAASASASAEVKPTVMARLRWGMNGTGGGMATPLPFCSSRMLSSFLVTAYMSTSPVTIACSSSHPFPSQPFPQMRENFQNHFPPITQLTGRCCCSGEARENLMGCNCFMSA